MNDRYERMKQLQELSMQYGRKYKSSQTGYVHFYHNNHDEQLNLAIPLAENFLFILTLFRSRTVENINEAKGMLEGLLYFQNREGKFPIYLHEYPFCKDRFLCVHLAAPIFWILKLFHQVLGEELNEKLTKVLETILSQAILSHEEKQAPYPLAVKIACVAYAGGKLLHNQEIELKGSILLETLRLNPVKAFWYSPASLGIILTSLTMVYHHLNESPWGDFWKYLEKTWHHPTGCYMGPAIKELQQKNEPQVTLYDLVMGFYSGKLSARVLKENPAHLEAALIQPTDDIFHEPIIPLKWEESGFIMYQNQDFAYSTVLHATKASIYEKGCFPFRLIWGDLNHVHSFVCHGNPSVEMETLADGCDLKFNFFLNESLLDETRENCREIAFSIDHSSHLNFLVENEKSSTFRIGETVSISGTSCLLILKTLLLEGNGIFMGHRMLGNRPSQISAKGTHRYDAYDFEIFLRTVSRNIPCRLSVSLSIRKEG